MPVGLSYYNPASVCMYVCCVTPSRRFASRALNFQGFIYDPNFGSSVLFFSRDSSHYQQSNYPLYITHYFVQLSGTIFQQLRTIDHNVIGLFYDCPKLRNTTARSSHTLFIITASITSQFRELDSKKVLLRNNKYQGIDEYFCDNVVYKLSIWNAAMSMTNGFMPQLDFQVYYRRM